jgi:Flp pilus assembly protein TadD
MIGEWGIHLEQSNRMEDVVKCYKNSLEIFPNNTIMLNNFAAHLLR